MDEKNLQNDKAWLLVKSQVTERPFVSKTAVIGSLIVRLREFWNSISTKWYVRPLLEQQNEFNHLVAQSILEHDDWFIAQDREQTAHNRNMAELTAQLIQTNRLLHAIDERLSRLELHQ